MLLKRTPHDVQIADEAACDDDPLRQPVDRDSCAARRMTGGATVRSAGAPSGVGGHPLEFGGAYLASPDPDGEHRFSIPIVSHD